MPKEIISESILMEDLYREAALEILLINRYSLEILSVESE